MQPVSNEVEANASVILSASFSNSPNHESCVHSALYQLREWGVTIVMNLTCVVEISTLIPSLTYSCMSDKSNKTRKLMFVQARVAIVLSLNPSKVPHWYICSHNTHFIIPGSHHITTTNTKCLQKNDFYSQNVQHLTSPQWPESSIPHSPQTRFTICFTQAYPTRHASSTL